MIALPPLRFQKISAALSSEDRSIRSNAARSSGTSCVWPLDTCSSRSSAMKSLTTEAIAMVPLPPLVTSWPVLRSSTATVMSAPDFGGLGGGLAARGPSSPVKAAAGSSGGASGSGAMLPSGATTVSGGDWRAAAGVP